MLAVAAARCRLALARCGRSSSVQARRHSPPVSPQQGAEVPDSLLSLVVSDCAQHTVASWMYHAIDEQHSAVGRSLSLDQLSGIRFQRSLETKNTFRLSVTENVAFQAILVCSAH